MSMPPLNIEPLLLGSHVAKVLSEIHRVAYAQLSPELDILRTSANFSAVLNEPKEQIVGESLTDLVWEFVGARDNLKAILNGKSPYLAFERVHRQRPNGQHYYLDLSITPLRNSELGDGLLLIAEDVTHTATLEQNLTQNHNEISLAKDNLGKANQQLQHLNRIKSIFLSMAAHDLRTPLSAINSYVDLIQRKLPEENLPLVNHDLTVIMSQIERLNNMISDFLDLDRIDQGKLTLRRESCDLKSIIKEVMSVMQVNADGYQISTEINVPDHELNLWADQDKLYRIVYNLVGNAIKYTQQEGHVQVQARQANNQVILRVMDDGWGMTEQQLGQLFQLYYRTQEAKERRISGTGLGLYIVKTLVEAHQGRIEVASQPGQGSTFTVYLPIIPDS